MQMSKHNYFYNQYCIQLSNCNKLRQLNHKPLADNEKIIDFSSNDYLLLSKDPRLINAAIDAGNNFGIGATGSRLLSGNLEIFSQLEQIIANSKKTESALIFNSGYQANSTVIPAIMNKKILGNQALVFFDKLNHASLYHGVKLANAQLVRYHHLDMNHLEKLLFLHHNDLRPKFIVSETVFGMDGDIVDLEKLITLTEKYHAHLYLDEAHATGIIGYNGYGLSTAYNFNNLAVTIMGTFSKAIGTCGAYIACSNIVKNYLINACTGFIYSTAISPMIVGATIKAWEILPTLNNIREQILLISKYTRQVFIKKGFNIGNSSGNIIPIIIGDESQTINLQSHLAKQNIIVSAVRPPSVPVNTSRLRIAINAGHTQENIDSLSDSIPSFSSIQ